MHSICCQTRNKNGYSLKKRLTPPKGPGFISINSFPWPFSSTIMITTKKQYGLLFVFYVIGDLITTGLFLTSHGQEANPLFIPLVESFQGFIYIGLIKIIVFILLIGLLQVLNNYKLNNYSKFIYIILLLLSILVVVSNIHVYLFGKNILGF